MKVESIAECSIWGILQYFGPAVTIMGLKIVLGLFESGRFTQVVLYFEKSKYEFFGVLLYYIEIAYN